MDLLAICFNLKKLKKSEIFNFFPYSIEPNYPTDITLKMMQLFFYILPLLLLIVPSECGKKWTSITSSSDGTKLAAGGDGNIWTSEDSGGSWTENTFVGAYKYWASITSSSDGTKLAAVDLYGNIWTSEDSGGFWIEDTN